MNSKHFTLFLLTGLMLSGCNTQIPTASCSAPETQKLLATLLTRQAQKLTVAKRDDLYDASTLFGAVKVNTLLAQLQIAVANVKMIQEDSNSRQSFCTGVLQVTVPTAILDDVAYVRDALRQPTIAQFASQLNIENSHNVFSQNLEYHAEYTLQPNGGGKDLHVGFKNEAWVHLLDEIVTSALLKPTLNEQEVGSVQLHEQPNPEVKPVNPEVKELAKLDAEKPSAMTHKSGLDKLNAELLEEEQAQKTLSQEPKDHVSEQVAPTLVPPVTTTKPKAPSFDCSKAKKPTDMTVCANPKLVDLDVKNLQLYKKAKSKNAAATKAIFLASIKSKYACGTDIGCIEEVYQKSIVNYGCVVSTLNSMENQHQVGMVCAF